jgi:chromosome segregation ATPase
MNVDTLAIMAALAMLGLMLMMVARRRQANTVWPISWQEALEKLANSDRRINELQRELDAVKRENALLSEENQRFQETQKLLLRQLADMQQRVSSLEHDLEILQSEKQRNAQSSPGNLRQILTTKFSDVELRALAFDLNLDLDALPGTGIEAKATELVAYFDRRDQLRRLADEVRRLRPGT